MEGVNTKLILESLRELSDKDFQQIAWNGKLGDGSMYLPEEAICQLFGDSGLDFYLSKKQSVFGQEIDDKLKQLGSLAESLPQQVSPDDLIESPSMIPVRKLASEILILIQSKSSSIRNF